MRTFSAILLAASAVLAQEIGFSGGGSVSSGSNAISNPNINTGVQFDSSLIVGHGSNDLFNNVVGSSFTNINSNTAIKANPVNNPSRTSVSGNDGWTANGDANALGPVVSDFDFQKRAGGRGGLRPGHHVGGGHFKRLGGHVVGTSSASGDVVASAQDTMWAAVTSSASVGMSVPGLDTMWAAVTSSASVDMAASGLVTMWAVDTSSASVGMLVPGLYTM
ncbi:hypothetical protein H4R19_001792 [Coemansia spiralis]|nr:hypothetical protein H4R19_001792 [Coemansia spiralis]